MSFSFKITVAAMAAMLTFGSGAIASTLGIAGTPTAGYAAPSTNADNFSSDFPFVELLDSRVGELDLLLSNTWSGDVTQYYEFRIDGVASTSTTAHYNSNVPDVFYLDNYLAVNSFTDYGNGILGERVATLFATEFVEVRMALGPERDWDFDWTRFDVQAASPIPVPAALPLLLTALGGLGFAARRRRKAA